MLLPNLPGKSVINFQNNRFSFLLLPIQEIYFFPFFLQYVLSEKLIRTDRRTVGYRYVDTLVAGLPAQNPHKELWCMLHCRDDPKGVRRCCIMPSVSYVPVMNRDSR